MALFTAFEKKENNKERTVAILDIGSGSVGGAVARIPADDQSLPTIIALTRTEIEARDVMDFEAFMEDMKKALDKTLVDLLDKRVGPPESVSVVLASPWYLSETRVISYSRPKQFIFSKRLAEELFQKEVVSLKESFDKKYNTEEGKSEPIEHHILGISLNGYAVDDPFGKHSRQVEMQMFASLAPKICLDNMRETIAKHLPHISITFSSFAMSSFIAVREKYIDHDSYLLIDIGGEVTDVALVAKNIMKTSLTFPFGQRTFFKHICDKLKIDMRDAEELFMLYSSNTLALRRRKKVDPIFKDIENIWSEAFRACLGTLPKTLTLPNTIFLTADPNVRAWFAYMIENEQYLSSMAPGQKCTVVGLEGPEFLTMCSVKDNTCDPFLMVEAISLTRKTV